MNTVLQQDQLMIMMVGGPNHRFDYHINPTNEWFYQLKGDMTLKIIEQSNFKEIIIKEGESFLLDANIPHSPQRFKDTLGLVIEMVRPSHSLDILQWYCKSCKHLMYETSLRVQDLNRDLIKPIKEYTSKKHTCSNCKTEHIY